MGYRDANQLTDRIAKRPYQCVLFDEWDKAHPTAHQILLHILERGELTDASGKAVSFRHTIVFVTSNVGAELFARGRMGFGENGAVAQGDVFKALQARFRPEILQRFHGIFVFTPPNTSALRAIAKRELAALASRAARRGTAMRWSAQVEHWLAQQAITRTQEGPERGAGAGRAIRTLTDSSVAQALAQALLTKRPASKYMLNIVNGSPVAVSATTKPPTRKQATKRRRV